MTRPTGEDFLVVEYLIKAIPGQERKYLVSAISVEMAAEYEAARKGKNDEDNKVFRTNSSFLVPHVLRI